MMLGIGLYFYFRTKNLSDYALAGRGLNSWVTSLSAQASDMSGWLLMGLPGYAYLSGLEAGWIALGLVVGTYFNWKFVAKRLRVFTEKAGNAITLPDYFSKRFLDKSGILRLLSALFILLFFLIYTSSGFVAGAKLFKSVFEISYHKSLIISVIIIISYTFLGGFNAVSWTDFIQGTLMFLAVIGIPLIGFLKMDNFITDIQSANKDLLDPFTNNKGEILSFAAIISLAAWGLGYFGQPHILARFMAIKSAEKIKKARIIAMVWVIISLAGSVAAGIIGYGYIAEPLKDSEEVFMVMVNDLAPPLLAGGLLAAILAAVMSTADSQLLVSSSSLVEDFYKIFLHKNASDKEQIWISRAAVILIAVVAYIIARNPESSVLGLVSYAWAGFGAAFGPVVIFSLYMKRMTAKAAIMGMLAGGITVLLWKQAEGGLFDIYEIIPGFVLGSLAIVIVSFLDGKPKNAVNAVFKKINV